MKKEDYTKVIDEGINLALHNPEKIKSKNGLVMQIAEKTRKLINKLQKESDKKIEKTKREFIRSNLKQEWEQEKLALTLLKDEKTPEEVAILTKLDRVEIKEKLIPSLITCKQYLIEEKKNESYLLKFLNEGMRLALNHPEKVKDEIGFRRRVAELTLNMLEEHSKMEVKKVTQEIRQKINEIEQILKDAGKKISQKEADKKRIQILDEMADDISLREAWIRNFVLYSSNNGKTPEEMSAILNVSIEEINKLTPE